MSNINEVNKNLFTNNLKQDGRAGQAGDKKKAVHKPVEDTAAYRTNKLLLELNINITFESKSSAEIQAAIKLFLESTEIDLSQFKINGKPILDLSQDEATELISDDGLFGIANTAQRIFDFAANGAGDNVERLQVARDAVLKGFKEAEDVFGGSLPEISYETLDRVLALLDEKLRDLGGTVVDVKV